MLIVEPGRQNHKRSCGLERWGGTEDRPTAFDVTATNDLVGEQFRRRAAGNDDGAHPPPESR